MTRRMTLAAHAAVLSLVLLAALPGWSVAQARQGLLSLPDARLFYEAVGSGDPIVVVHGGPGLDHNYLRPGLDVLSTRNTVVYYDQRGTGRSDAPLDSTGINFDAFVDDVEQLRQALGYDRITVLAHSFGGLIGLEYALRYPEHTRALILMNSTEPGRRWQTQTAVRQQAARTPEDSAAVADLVASEGFQARSAPVLSEIYRISFKATLRNPERVSELDLELSRRTAQNGQDVARLLGTSLGPVDWWDRLADLTTPTLVVHGRHDLPPTAMAEELAAALPQGRLVILNTGHFPYMEDPAGLLEAVSAFLTGLER